MFLSNKFNSLYKMSTQTALDVSEISQSMSALLTDSAWCILDVAISACLSSLIWWSTADRKFSGPRSHFKNAIWSLLVKEKQPHKLISDWIIQRPNERWAHQDPRWQLPGPRHIVKKLGLDTAYPIVTEFFLPNSRFQWLSEYPRVQ